MRDRRAKLATSSKTACRPERRTAVHVSFKSLSGVFLRERQISAFCLPGISEKLPASCGRRLRTSDARRTGMPCSTMLSSDSAIFNSARVPAACVLNLKASECAALPVPPQRSDEYLELKKLREGAAQLDAWAIPGVPERR